MYIYIKEAKNREDLIKKVDMPKFFEKIIINFKKVFNIITIKKIDELHYLYIIPKIRNAKIIEGIIKKKGKAKIVLSKELKKYEKQLNLENENKIIVYFLYNILEYIMNITDMKIELQNLYILANEYNEKKLQIIKYLAAKVKTVNIVTNNVKNYNILEEKLYKEQGILITVANNKNKTLKRAKIIINLDFNNEEINSYKINRTSIIINCVKEKMQISYFQGIIINNIDIFIEKKEIFRQLYREFNEIDIYNSLKINKTNYIENINEIQQDKIKIKNLVGNNGIIDVKEIANIQKNLDKI